MADNRPVQELTAEDLSFFKREGYLIKRRVLDPELIARAHERFWAALPPPLRADDPATWVGPVDGFADGRNVMSDWTWKFRTPGSEPWMVRLLATDPSVWRMAEQLVGSGRLQQPDRIRGIYAVLPEGDAPERPVHCHVDRHAFHLGVVGYIDHVARGGGGFTVWPQSHRRFYHDFTAQHDMQPTAEYERDLELFNARPYVDCHGGPGDVVFWHHRLGHSAGHNRRKRLRLAVLYDYRAADLQQVAAAPPHTDMWHDWSPELRAAPLDAATTAAS